MNSSVKCCLALCALASLAAGCDAQYYNLRPRFADERDPGDSLSVKDPLPAVGDTLVLVSALCCGENYDWRRDTAFGMARYELLLLEEDSVLVRIPAGEGCQVSPDPDLHHIVGGHLYTECCSGEKTILGCDGKELFRFDGRYLLRGLFPGGNGLFSLWVPREGKGFLLLDGNDEIMESADGVPFGGFDKPSYLPYGALYEDMGQICFAYFRDGEDYFVRDGETQSMSSLGFPGHAMDVRQMDGEMFSYSGSAWGRAWDNLEIWPGPVVTGEYTLGYIDMTISGAYHVEEQRLDRLLGGGSNIYYNTAAGVHGIKRTPEGLVMRLEGGEKSILYEGRYWYMPASCACLAGRHFMVGLTPLEKTSHPRVEAGYKILDYPWLDGLITGVSYIVR